MIPRIKHRRFGSAGDRWAFVVGDRGRPLRLVIDAQTTPPGDALDCLRGFAHHPDVEIISTGDDLPNRLRLGEYEPTDHIVPVDLELGNRLLRSGVYAFDLVRFADEFTDVEQLEARRMTFLAAACEDNGVDGLITESRVIHELLPRPLADHANPMSSQEGAALLGLYLRGRGDFSVEYDDGHQVDYGRHWFYFVLMRELLPSSWRWFSGCVYHSTSTGDDELLLVGQSMMERVDRALRARDRLHRELQRPPSQDTADESLFYFDVVLLMLGGAFDAAALVADAVHALSTPVREVSWANDGWLKRLKAVNGPLAALMKPKSGTRVARELVAVLRNTIHGQGMRTITYQSGGQRDELAIIPKASEARLEDLANQAGGAEALGLDRLPGGPLCVRTGSYIDAVLPLAIAALNEIMEATPVEQLPGAPNQITQGPPNEQTHNNIFHPAIRRRLRLLAGLT